MGFKRPELIEPLNNLASSLVQLKEFEEADQCFRRAVSLCGETLGSDHPNCVTTLENYAVGLQKFGSKNNARVVTQAAREARKSTDRRNGVDSVVDLKALRSEVQPKE
jgi:Tfp pilus assembly protein PilF